MTKPKSKGPTPAAKPAETVAEQPAAKASKVFARTYYIKNFGKVYPGDPVTKAALEAWDNVAVKGSKPATEAA